ncbi:uncharacterized protein LOC128626372 [Artibeus jamaicensis]|uniref:uncharacterized protein LOC128626372 n=1 Tax=Artibeus jamaicensis TaxID=9417 RepID=UPI00235AAB22|nr:uncharacterized protein LOC128626372 [Artibeus jamaicensis]
METRRRPRSAHFGSLVHTVRPMRYRVNCFGVPASTHRCSCVCNNKGPLFSSAVAVYESEEQKVSIPSPTIHTRSISVLAVASNSSGRLLTAQSPSQTDYSDPCCWTSTSHQSSLGPPRGPAGRRRGHLSHARRSRVLFLVTGLETGSWLGPTKGTGEVCVCRSTIPGAFPSLRSSGHGGNDLVPPDAVRPGPGIQNCSPLLSQA